MIVLDTNAIIYYVQNDPAVVRWIEREILRGTRFAVSTMTVVELFSFPQAHLDEVFRIETVLRSTLIVDVDLSHAREAAHLRSIYQLKAIDAVIAATAILLDVPLATRDQVFRKIKACKVIAL